MTGLCEGHCHMKGHAILIPRGIFRFPWKFLMLACEYRLEVILFQNRQQFNNELCNSSVCQVNCKLFSLFQVDMQCVDVHEYILYFCYML